MRRREAGKLLAAWAAIRLAPRQARAQSCSAGVHAPTAAEIKAGVKIVDGARCPGDWRRYGADPAGRSDSTAAIQAACNSNSVAFDSDGGTYLVTAKIQVPSGVTVRGAGAERTTVSCPDGGASVFFVSQASGVTIEKLKISVTAASKLAHTGAVEFLRSSNCACRDCEITGVNWSGVLLYDADHCVVDGCSFHDFQGSVQDSANVMVYRQSHHNSITNNRCFGGNWHGIAIQDPYAHTLPSENTVSGNTVGRHLAYGIMAYLPSPGDSFNKIANNGIADVQGAVLNNTSGAGIYVAGAGAGGTSVANNTVRNCCVQTNKRQLAPAGIGVNGIPAGAAPVSVSGNTVSDIGGYDGIMIVSSTGASTVTGNTVTLPPGNSTGTPIYIDASSNATVSRNSAARAPGTAGRCIFVYANVHPASNIAVTGNVCSGGRGPQIEFAAAGGASLSNVTCTDNICSGEGRNENCVRLSGAPGAAVSGNRCVAS